MQIRVVIAFIIITTTFSQWAFSDNKGRGFPIEESGCRGNLPQKGIPVGNNKYEGKDCSVKLINERTGAVVTNDGKHRNIASEHESYEEEMEKTTLKEIEITEEPSGYDYANED